MPLGEQILHHRKRKKMSLRALASKVGVTASHLSMVERNLSSPSIDTLRAISNALDTPIFDFLIDTEQKDPVVRRNERLRVRLNHSPVAYELLIPDLSGKIEMFMVELDSGDYNLAKPTKFSTEEVIVVLNGRMKLQFHDKEYILETGDSIRVNGMFLEKIQPIGDQKLVFISAVTPPFF